MLTRHLLFGMNLVSLGGFVLMGAGTALVFLGLYLAPPPSS